MNVLSGWKLQDVVTASGWQERKMPPTGIAQHSSVMSIRNLNAACEKFVKMRKNYVKYWIPCRHRKKEKEKENKK